MAGQVPRSRHAEHPSPPSLASVVLQPPSFGRAAVCSDHLGCPFYSFRPSVPSFPHLQPTPSAPSLQAETILSASPAASTAEVPSRDLGKWHLLVADLTQFGWHGQCHTVSCSMVSPRLQLMHLRCQIHLRVTLSFCVGREVMLWDCKCEPWGWIAT